MPSRLFTSTQESSIVERYVGGESARSLAREFNTFHSTIANLLARHNTVRRTDAERNRKYSLDPHIFDQIDTEAKAYWLGFLFADGNVSRRTLTLALSEKDADHVARFKDFMQSEAPTAIYDRKLGFVCHIAITDEHLTDRLREIGIETQRPRPCLCLYSTPVELQHHWIRGFFDGDGSVGKKKGLDFCGVPEILKLVQSIVSPHVGVLGSLQKHSTAKLWYLEFSGRPSGLRVRDYMYKDATVWLPRKRDRFDKWETPAPTLRDNSNGRWRLKDAT